MRRYSCLFVSRPHGPAPPATWLPVCWCSSESFPGSRLAPPSQAPPPSGVLLRLAQREQGWAKGLEEGPARSCGHSPAGHCSQNSLGVSIFSVQRTGQLYGTGNKAATVCHRGGRRRGAAGRVVNPVRSPGLWQGQASQAPPTLFPRHGGEGFFPWEDGVCLRMGKGRLLHSATAPSLPSPPAEGRALGRGSAPPFAYKHLLSTDFVPEFSSPQGAVTKALPTCKITTGSSGPQEANGQDPNSF